MFTQLLFDHYITAVQRGVVGSARRLVAAFIERTENWHKWIAHGKQAYLWSKQLFNWTQSY